MPLLLQASVKEFLSGKKQQLCMIMQCVLVLPPSSAQVGEVLDNRYEVFACKGKGVFSTVLRARDKLKLVPNPVTGIEEFAEVAIKVSMPTVTTGGPMLSTLMLLLRSVSLLPLPTFC